MGIARIISINLGVLALGIVHCAWSHGRPQKFLKGQIILERLTKFQIIDGTGTGLGA